MHLVTKETEEDKKVDQIRGMTESRVRLTILVDDFFYNYS